MQLQLKIGKKLPPSQILGGFQERLCKGRLQKDHRTTREEDQILAKEVHLTSRGSAQKFQQLSIDLLRDLIDPNNIQKGKYNRFLWVDHWTYGHLRKVLRASELLGEAHRFTRLLENLTDPKTQQGKVYGFQGQSVGLLQEVHTIYRADQKFIGHLGYELTQERSFSGYRMDFPGIPNHSSFGI